jgi:putative addiction module component (TIGR02574 family)
LTFRAGWFETSPFSLKPGTVKRLTFFFILVKMKVRCSGKFARLGREWRIVMRINEIPEISKLSTAEKIRFVEDFWDDIIADGSTISVPQSHINDLEKRFIKYAADPGALLSIEELQTRVTNSK